MVDLTSHSYDLKHVATFIFLYNVCTYLCLYISLSIYQSIGLSIYLPLYEHILQIWLFSELFGTTILNTGLFFLFLYLQPKSKQNLQFQKQMFLYSNKKKPDLKIVENEVRKTNILQNSK